MSTLKVDTIQDTNAVEMYLCKAWVNFDGTWTSGDPIRGDGNVSSITDNGTGQYTINFTTAMPDTNYSTQLTNGYVGSGEDWVFMTEWTGRLTTSFSMRIVNYTASAFKDSSSVSVAIFR